MRNETTLTLNTNKNITISYIQGSDTIMVKIMEEGKLKNWVPYRSLTAAKKYIANLVKQEYKTLEYTATNAAV